MLEEHGYTAGCLKCPRARSGRPSVGTRRSEDCRRRFENLLREAQGPRMLRADQRVNEHLAERLWESVEGRPAGSGTSSSSSSSG
eukprot:7500432-Alexandrium_andersonii.AAC.1